MAHEEIPPGEALRLLMGEGDPTESLKSIPLKFDDIQDPMVRALLERSSVMAEQMDELKIDNPVFEEVDGTIMVTGDVVLPYIKEDLPSFGFTDE